MKHTTLRIIDWTLAVVLLLGLWHYNHSVVITVIAAVVFMIAMSNHKKNLRMNGNYLYNLFALKENNNRIYAFDYLRVLAVVFVILTHAIKLDLADGLIVDANRAQIFSCFQVFFLSCNLIYVMLSGALLMPYREESLGHFFKRRFARVLIPMIIYYAFYMWITREIVEFSWGALWTVCVNFLIGNIPKLPHFGMIYIIVCTYLMIPFLRYMVKDMPYKTLTGLVLMIVVFSGLELILPAFTGVSLMFTFELASWAGVTLIGYWLTRPETKKYYRNLIVLGLAAVAVMVWMVYNRDDYITLTTNISPIMECISMGIFALFMMGRNLLNHAGWLVRIISKYSYSMILVHWWALLWITRGILGIQVDSYYGVGVVFSLIVTIAVSLVVAFVVDHMVVDAFTQSK